MDIFNTYSSENVKISDEGLKRYLTFKELLIPHTYGRETKKKFWKSKVHIVERLIKKINLAGHKGKKHWRTSGVNAGKTFLAYNAVKNAFRIISEKTKKNPLQVLVNAIEFSAPCEEITTIEYGGIKHPKSVDVAPQRRVDLALRWITQGAFSIATTSKTKLPEALASIIINSAKNDSKTFPVKKRIEVERQAAASR